ncbi:uncharacterized protein LAJ45_00709 [Morchella importuna]|uniref:uncharacterized protein n=1 Tax=Morchella importuna TaxID=1174673 RepID=UPI001E8D8D17|nr:uncharacterized protein LAJ45_00709 [Morchella importuna]KAH8155699.1 hypothetical protein LAJ45_00709 [Morchella importuna]
MASSQQRDHGGHSHGHHHHHDNTYLTSKNKADAGVRITRLGLYTNVGMAIGKGIGGWYFNSQALIADAFHSLTDLISDIMTLATVSFALKKPTERFPNGYGKIESMGSLGVSSLLLVGGLLMGYHALDALYAQFFLDHAEALAHAAHGHGHGHGHSHSHTDLGPNVNAAWLAAVSILIKEWLYQATMKVAKERKSSVLASNAVHHRIDSLTAVVALASITGSHFLDNASWLDPVGGLLVSIMVIAAGFGNTRAALTELVDVGLDDEVKGDIREAAEKALALRQERLSLRGVSGLKSGQNLLAELTVEVPVGTTVAQTARIEEELRGIVGAEVRGIRRVKVRFVEEGVAEQTEFVEKDQSLELEKHEHHDHDHDHEPKGGKAL